jgi:primary-amine oxidase
MEPVSIPTGVALHPLEPLTGEEISATAQILKREKDLADTARFVFVSLHEPTKAQLAELGPDSVPPREAHVVLYEKAQRKTYEAIVDLDAEQVADWKLIEGVQPAIMAEEFMESEEVVKADPDWQAAMRKRGVEDFDLAMIDPWAASYTGEEDHPSLRRICRPLTWMRSAPGEHGYARPVEGLVVTVDLDEMKVIDVTDHGVVPIPQTPANYEEPWIFEEGNVPAFTEYRQDVKPIEITQPEGPSYTVDGHHVQWQKWDLRIGFTPREGLVLHQVGYDDRGTLRPVIHRAGLAEMYVPYGDPAPTHRIKNVFDQGEYGIGWLANPLTLGCDCVGEITYFDGVVNDQDGNPVTIPNAICMHEEDAGIAWKHTDFRTEKVEVRRLRRLVVSTIVTVGNYEYGYFWYLYNDGTIEYEVKLSGVLSVGAYDPAKGLPEYGTVLSEGLYAPNHQHFFCVRMDMAVDGPLNTVVEIDSVTQPVSPQNPTGNAWKAVPTVLETEQAAIRSIDQTKARFWKIESADKTSATTGKPTAFKLMPGDHAAPVFGQETGYGPRSGFTTANVWVTKYDPAERCASGEYPNQHPGGTGLPSYAAGDEPIVGEDLVVWYSFGAHHVVRPEDWPVMPVSHIGFKLKPAGFFDGNPALDLPPSEAHCAHHANGNGNGSSNGH